MPSKLFTAKYYDTYYLANIVHRIAFDRYGYARVMESFFEGSGTAFVTPFSKWSAFHSFIEYIVSFTLRAQTLEADPSELLKHETTWNFVPADCQPNLRRLLINDAFDTHGLEHQSFEDWLREGNKSFETSDKDDVFEYCDELLLAGPWEELVHIITEEIFYLLFSNRAVVQAFNESIAERVNEVVIEEVELEGRSWFKRNGVLQRVDIPSWASIAIYHRDKGLCTFCCCDLTGLINLSGDPHCDHIIPLASGGLNDVTNLQLLCKDCNLKKSHKLVGPSEHYQRWY